jgi:hypothetical protein
METITDEGAVMETKNFTVVKLECTVVIRNHLAGNNCRGNNLSGGPVLLTVVQQSANWATNNSKKQ